MKKPLFAALMIALLSISLLAGCQASAQGTEPQRSAATAPTASAPAPTEALPERITAEEAEAIALAHAGLTSEQLSYLRTELDYDGGQPAYDIDFYCDGWEYDYEIHAGTGAILRSEAEPPKAVPTEPAPTEPPATEPSAAASGRLTKEEARDTALTHAGLTADQVMELKIEFDYDDGVPEYEIEFRSGGYEYDYDIHAETGAIRSHGRERDD